MEEEWRRLHGCLGAEGKGEPAMTQEMNQTKAISLAEKDGAEVYRVGHCFTMRKTDATYGWLPARCGSHAPRAHAEERRALPRP